ncbi:MAG TPA: MBL fold metallo-hydrolase [Marinagarivorans sp.]
MKSSDNFQAGKFQNLEPIEAKSLWGFIKARMTTDWAKWPKDVIINEGAPPPTSLNGSNARITFINHATVLIQVAGLNIITDPHFTERCSPLSFAGPKRVHKPGIAFHNLPKIDAVLISHDHYDHLDLATIEKLVHRDAPVIFAGLGVKRHLEQDAKVIEMDWWDQKALSDNVAIHFAEVQHFSGRGLWDKNTTLWGGFVIEVRGKTKIYFGGDSGYGGHYHRTYDRFGPMDLALIPIGAYAPRDFMAPVHLDPAQAVQAHKDLHAKQSIGIHFGTFQLTAEQIDEPERLLKSARAEQQLGEDEFITLQPGSAFNLQL